MTEFRLGVAGIGPQKTGSTWLDLILREHPELCLPAEVKETFFLDRHYERGWQWYARHFDHCRQDQLYAEVGPTWFDVEGVVQRLHSAAPDCSIVATLRDPAERSWSLFRHHFRKGRVPNDFEIAVEVVPRILEASRYREHLGRWIDRFGPDRVHLVFLTDVTSQPERVLESLTRFLRVEPFEAIPSVARRRVNPASGARWPVLARWAVKVGRLLRQRGRHRLVDAAKKVMGGLIYRRNVEQPDLPPALRKRLVKCFENDIRYVEEIADRNLDEWRHS